MKDVNFTFEQFCTYVENKMSDILYINNKYEIFKDTQELGTITPVYGEIESLKYIYDNKLFKELHDFLKDFNMSYEDKQVLKGIKKLDLSYEDKQMLKGINLDISKKLELRDNNKKYEEIRNTPGEKCYRICTRNQIDRLKESDIKYAAFDNGNGKYRTVFMHKDLSKINSIIKTDREVHKSHDIER